MLTPEETTLIVVDIQGALAESVWKKERLYKNVAQIIDAARLIGIPILWAEQLPSKLGPTRPIIAERLAGLAEPIEKETFSVMRSENFARAINELKRKSALLCGIEAHICVYQSALDLIGSGYETHILSDAISSRSKSDYKVALGRLAQEGAKISSVEMAIFEMANSARFARFRELIAIVK